MRGIEDVLRRAVVLLEQDDARAREVALEVEDVADVGGAPRVDRLVGVADDADVAVAGGEQLRQLVLGDVRVLELVDEDVLVAVLVLVADASCSRSSSTVSMIRSSKSSALFSFEHCLVALVDARDDLAEVVAGARARTRAGHAARSWRARSARGWRARRSVLDRCSRPSRDALDHGHLVGVVVDGEVRGRARCARRFDAQDAGADGVEGAERRRRARRRRGAPRRARASPARPCS